MGLSLNSGWVSTSGAEEEAELVVEDEEENQQQHVHHRQPAVCARPLRTHAAHAWPRPRMPC